MHGMTSIPTSPRVLLEGVKAGRTAHEEGLCRVDNPYTRRLTRYEAVLIRDMDRANMAEAWWKGWDLAKQAVPNDGMRYPASDSP